MISRRNFLQAIGLASAAGIVLSTNGAVYGQTSKSDEFFRIPEEITSDPVYSFTSAHFVPYVNTDFEIRAESQRRPEQLRLLDVKVLNIKHDMTENVQGESFSLLFFVPRGTKLKANRFEFSHFALGTFTLTISPVGAEPNRYEAVINHLSR